MAPASSDPMLYIVACGSPAAQFVPDVVERAQHSGWRVCVIASPDGEKFLDLARIVRLTGYPVRTMYKHPLEPDVLPPADAVVAFPATFNTLNKWVLGISDTLAVGILCEYSGLGKTVIAVPCVGTNSGLDTHPAFNRSLAELRSLGVKVVYDRQTYSMDNPELSSMVAAAIAQVRPEESRLRD